MAHKYKHLVIYNEANLIDYIDKTKAMSERNNRETTSLEDIKKAILQYVNKANTNNLICFINYGFQIECMKGFERVHCFVYKAEFASELSVAYRGTLK